MKVCTDIFPKTNGFYVDAIRHRELMKIRKSVRGHDRDAVLIYGGYVGDGKSTIAAQDMFILDKRFDHTCMCQNEEQFKQKIAEFEAMGEEGKHRSICLDEAFEGLNTAQVASKAHKLLVNMLQTIRQLNLFIGIVLPNFFDLSKTVAIFRSKWLTFVYSRKGERGYFRTWGKEKKRELFVRGKKLYNYHAVKPSLVGRFTKFMPIDDAAYRKMKSEALKELMNKDEMEGQGIYKTQLKTSRNNAVKALYHEKNMPVKDIAVMFGVHPDLVYKILEGKR